MAAIAIEKFLEPVADDAPCGENLEYDAAFGELERAARGKPERQSGDKVLPAELPKWREVYAAAEELLQRSRDLRIAFYLTHAGLNIDGIAALAAGLRLVHGLLENYWDCVYPALDEDDDNDPTIRVNSLMAFNDREGLTRSLAAAAIVDSRVAGRFSLRDIRIARGEINATPGDEPPDGALIDAAFMDCDLDQLTATLDAAKQAAAALELIEGLLRERVGAELAPDFDALRSELAAILAILAPHLAARGVGDGGAGESAGPGGAVLAAEASLGQIQSREDAIRILDRLVEYFRKNEPSSPVPLLLKRAKRLVAKDFMEILQDLAPDAVAQAKVVSGGDQDE